MGRSLSGFETVDKGREYRSPGVRIGPIVDGNFGKETPLKRVCFCSQVKGRPRVGVVRLFPGRSSRLSILRSGDSAYRNVEVYDYEDDHLSP